MVSDLVWCVLEIGCLIIMCIRFANLNLVHYGNKWIIILEYLGLVAVAYLFLLLYRVFNWV